MVESKGLNPNLAIIDEYRHYAAPVNIWVQALPAGGKYRARTYDPLLVRQMLSQLS